MLQLVDNKTNLLFTLPAGISGAQLRDADPYFFIQLYELFHRPPPRRISDSRLGCSKQRQNVSVLPTLIIYYKAIFISKFFIGLPEKRFVHGKDEKHPSVGVDLLKDTGRKKWCIYKCSRIQVTTKVASYNTIKGHKLGNRTVPKGHPMRSISPAEVGKVQLALRPSGLTHKYIHGGPTSLIICSIVS